MKDIRLSLRHSVIICGAFTLLYLLTNDYLAQIDGIGALSVADLLFALCGLMWLTVTVRWLILGN